MVRQIVPQRVGEHRGHGVPNLGLVLLGRCVAVLQRDLALVFRTDKALSRAALAFIEIAVKLKTGGAAPAVAKSS